MRWIDKEFVQSHFDGATVERFALNDFRAGAGKKSFMFGRIVVIHDITDDGIQNRITEKLHPFVVDPFFRRYLLQSRNGEEKATS